MKRNKLQLSLLLVLSIFLLAGCGSKNVADVGFKSPEQAVSIPSLSGMEERGVQYVFFFPVIADPGIARIEGFLHPVEAADGTKKMVNDGVFPLMAIKNDWTISKTDGFYFLTNMNVFGDNFALAVVVGRKNDFRKIFPLSRDGHLAADVNGNSLEYESEKFSDNEIYRVKVSAKGHSPKEIDQTFRKYYEDRGIEVPLDDSFVTEVKVGSPEWSALKNLVTDRLNFGYRTMSGEARQGYLHMDKFKEEYSKSNGATATQRFWKNFNVAFTGEPTSSAVLTGGSAVNALIQSGTGSPDGLYASAICKRGDFRNQFASMQQENKDLIRILHSKIWKAAQKVDELKEKIIRMGGTP